MANRNPRPAYPIASVDNALTLLAMVGAQDSVRISEVSRALGVVPSSASRLMAMLQYHDLVVHDPETRAYHAGPALLRLGIKVVERMDVRQLVRPIVARLSAELDETVHFVVLDGASVLFVEGIESRRAVRTSRRNGEVRPAFCVSAGKAMLATLSEEELDRRLPSRQLPPNTPKSLTTRAALQAELAAIRKKGYATSVQESEMDIAAIGAAILTPAGKLIGGLSVSVPMTRYSRAAFATYVPPLLDAVAEASEALTHGELFTDSGSN